MVGSAVIVPSLLGWNISSHRLAGRLTAVSGAGTKGKMAERQNTVGNRAVGSIVRANYNAGLEGIAVVRIRRIGIALVLKYIARLKGIGLVALRDFIHAGDIIREETY